MRRPNDPALGDDDRPLARLVAALVPGVRVSVPARFRLTVPALRPEDELHIAACLIALRYLCPSDAVVNTWVLRNASSAASRRGAKRLGALPGRWWGVLARVPSAAWS